MRQTNIKGLKLAVLTMCCLNLTSMIISPTLPGVANEFPDISITWVQNLSVMSSLTAIISAQISGYIMRYMSKRYLAIGSFLIYLVTGLSIIYTDHFLPMLLLRCINGFTLGLNSTLSTCMIAEYFTGEERKKIMGFRMPFQNVTAMFFSASSGVISQCFGWRFSYLLFLTALLPLTFGILFLPREGSGPVSDTKSEVKFGYRAFFAECKGIVVICLIHMMAVLATGINSNNISLLVTEKGLGDSGLGGVVTAVYLLAASIAGIFFGRINRVFEKRLYPLACFCTMAGLFIAVFSRSVIVLILAEVIVGFWWSTFMARMNVTLACASDGRTRNVVFSFFVATMNLGTFLNPMVATKITEMLGSHGAASRIMVGAVIMVIIGVVTLYLNREDKKFIKGIII